MKRIKVSIGVNNRNSDVHLVPGKNLYTGIQKYVDEFGEANSMEEDLINLAAGIFGCDLAVKRDDREHYIRSIELCVEVVNLHAFERVKAVIENALYVVSKDNWTVFFFQKPGIPVADFNCLDKEGAVLLFSGGIDSMCAASEFIKEKKSLVLVSHNSHANHVVEKCQENVHSALESYYKTTIKHVNIKVYGRNQARYPFPKDDLRENTQRTRSFLFLTLAALVTRKSGFKKVLFMAENGQFAIHLPLNSARVGPFSTHTADPEFVKLIQQIFRTLFNNSSFEIINPFLYKTKAEVFAVLPEKLRKDAELSASCWMISRIPENKHCGYCIPCLTRRIAMEYNNIFIKEYHVDVFKTDVTKLADTDDRKRNLVDYLEFVTKFNNVTNANKHELLSEFPELYNPSFDMEAAVNLYKRVAKQSFEVFKKYPKVLKLL
ncbi:7-cyano-7-deazaguanine synthase [Longitalea arenae]|uniref:7-cyano-7-deazaguanine synthase n=1 Tax=Longitalea arenae TaxID=2812558 RepID=UPI0019678991|nr:7-cyano-7-deazaguanine synthase [Longitalea arenae]